MNKRNRINLLMALAALVAPALSITQEKKPVKVKEVWGNMPREYAIVYTTIVNNPKKDEKPIIRRKEVKRVKAGDHVKNVDKILSIPQKPIEYKSDIPDYVAKIAGAIPNPKVALVGNALALLAKEGLRIAGQKMTEFYGNDPTTINMLEIVPTQYYRINEVTGEIQITDNFMPDLEKWNNLLSQYIPVAEEWNAVITQFNKAVARWQKTDPNETDQKQIDALNTMEDTKVKPVLRKRLAIETQLATYALHRMAIIPDFDKPGNSCNAIGYQGPWSLNVYMYIGAKQTNIFNVDFCVKDTGADQNIIVELIPNSINPGTSEFQPGGLKLVSTLDQSVTFPEESGAQRVGLKNQRSRLLNWFDELIVKDKATNINDYLISFDVMKVRDEMAKEAEKTQKKEKKKNLELFDAAMQSAQEASDKVLEQKEKELELREKELEVKEKEKEAKEAKKDNENNKEEEEDEEGSGLLDKIKEIVKAKGTELIDKLTQSGKKKKPDAPVKPEEELTELEQKLKKRREKVEQGEVSKEIEDLEKALAEKRKELPK